jgi:ABC-type transport system involved in multi-copper enzyme maturation permease subunit
MTSSLLGVLLLDREPLGLANLGGLALAWLQDAGGFAALGLAVYLLLAMLSPTDQPASARLRMPVTRWMVIMAVLCLFTYAALVAIWIMGIGKPPDPPKLQVGESIKYVPPKVEPYLQPMLLALGGLFAILGIGQPFARDLFKLRFRRIAALAKVCFLEAFRNRVFWVFLLYMLVFLFPIQWFAHKPEDELRSPIGIFSIVKNLLLTIPFLILASFAIPTDVKHQTIFTVVSKPVERFEIALGRFFGYTGLMTIALLGMVAVSVVYIYTTSFNVKAQEESFKARVTARGKLSFKAFSADYKGTNVGREFEYRTYIGGSKDSRERAVWAFDSVPGNLLRRDRDSVPCEYTFDIFRLTKGEENHGVDINVRICTWQTGQKPSPVRGEGTWLWTEAERGRRYEEERQQINDKLKTGGYGSGYERSLDSKSVVPGTLSWKLVDDLARKYGFYEVPEVEVYDYRTGSVPVPVGLFEAATEGDAKDADGKPLPRLTVYVKCLSGGQMLGMAQGDLYFVEGEKSFAENYFKSAFGLWCRLAIVIGLAVALSTYLAAMIALFGTALLYIVGHFPDFIMSIGTRTSVGGGPLEASLRMVRSETPTMPLEPTGAMKAIDVGDDVFAWFFRRVFNVLPDVDAFSWTDFLAEGYNVNFEYLIVNLLILIGYLLPWGVLAYYLIRNREVAA